MGLQLPHFNSEAEEADWWYDNRALTEAEFIIAAADGKLVRKNRPKGESAPITPMDIPEDEVAASRALLEASGIWLEGQPTRLTNDPISDREARELRKAS